MLIRFLDRHPRLLALVRNARRATGSLYRRMRAGSWGAPRVRNRGARNQIVFATTDLRGRVRVSFKGDDNRIHVSRDAMIDGLNITIEGSGNDVSIGASRVYQGDVSIAGDSNTVEIGDACTLRELRIVCALPGNSIAVGSGTAVNADTELVAVEGTSITIGEGCLIGGWIRFRTSDSHSVLDSTGRRINPARDIVIGKHVWIASYATFLKGSAVAHDSIVGAHAVVTKAFASPHISLAGNPARQIRSGVSWSEDLLPCDPMDATGGDATCGA